MALAGALHTLRLSAAVDAPELPGIGGPALTVGELISQYLDGRDYDTAAGRLYVARYCAGIRKRLGRLPASALAGADGEVVLRKWRDELWKRPGLLGKPMANQTVKNYLFQVLAVLRWVVARDRKLFPWPLPRVGGEYGVKYVRPDTVLRKPIFDFFSEGDLRALRDGGFEDWRKYRRFGAGTEDRIGQCRLVLSWAFYTGMHAGDCKRVVPEWFSLDMGRFWRHNTKSASSVDVEPFDMPEQLVLDCEEEQRRIGRSWREGEQVCGPEWRAPSDSINRACRRLGLKSKRGRPFSFPLARRSCVRELAIRGWRVHEIAAYLGHIDDDMVRTTYEHCSELGLVSPVRVAWRLGSGPGGRPTNTAPVLRFARTV
jgi:integrase